MHERRVNVELYFKVYSTKPHYVSTHLGGIHSEGNEKSWVSCESKTLWADYLPPAGVAEVWVGQRRGGAGYLALVELLSILRTAWAMASRSMP